MQNSNFAALVALIAVICSSALLLVTPSRNQDQADVTTFGDEAHTEQVSEINFDDDEGSTVIIVDDHDVVLDEDGAEITIYLDRKVVFAQSDEETQITMFANGDQEITFLQADYIEVPLSELHSATL